MNEAPAALHILRSEEDFLQLARTYNAGTPLETPHVIFVIDRHYVPAHIDYINTPHFQLHERYIREQRIGPVLDKVGVDRNYLEPDRRFLLGTLSRQAASGQYTYEFWEGDLITPTLLALSDRTVKASFFAPVVFKTNSTLHARRAQQLGVAFITQEMLVREQPYMALNTGDAVGRLRIVPSPDAMGDLGPRDIAVLRQVPMSLAPVAGVITERPSTALSHVNLLAKGWGIPNAYVQGAAAVLQPLDGQWVVLNVANAQYRIRPATPEEIGQPRPTVRTQLLLQPDLASTAMARLGDLRAGDSQRCGAKAANLGVVWAASISGVVVPDGFCIPFAHYAQFAKRHGLADRMAAMRQAPGFESQPEVRKKALAQLQNDMAHWPIDPAVSGQWQRQWREQLQGKGVFVRSSSNSEDLAHFSGAGLYTTVPNVTAAAALDDAVRTVWASVFNFEAYEARRAAGVDDGAVVMAVLVQAAVNASSAGVMVTRDPFDAARPYVTYISAKRGLGIRVVEGARIAEQVMYSSWSKAVQVVSQSDETTALQLHQAGGVQEVPVTQRQVLTDDAVRRLSAVADAIKRRFGQQDQDIEWAMQGQQIIILQARPYVDGQRSAR
ncbi:MAG: PEP/pyruvate-binding domain-containing protein [Giesbergeria sp.]